MKFIEFRSFKSSESLRVKKRVLFFTHIILFLSYFSIPIFSEEKWTGVDESVVEKYAKEHGREAKEPLINTDQGDLLLFVFLLGGAVGGFIGGYCWRMLVVEKSSKVNNKNRK